MASFKTLARVDVAFLVNLNVFVQADVVVARGSVASGTIEVSHGKSLSEDEVLRRCSEDGGFRGGPRHYSWMDLVPPVKTLP